jgi:hypothetical protein
MRALDRREADLLATLADCPKARSPNIHDRCNVRYEIAAAIPATEMAYLGESQRTMAAANWRPYVCIVGG